MDEQSAETTAIIFRRYTELLFDSLAGWQHGLFANRIVKLATLKPGMMNRKVTWVGCPV